MLHASAANVGRRPKARLENNAKSRGVQDDRSSARRQLTLTASDGSAEPGPHSMVNTGRTPFASAPCWMWNRPAYHEGVPGTSTCKLRICAGVARTCHLPPGGTKYIHGLYYRKGKWARLLYSERLGKRKTGFSRISLTATMATCRDDMLRAIRLVVGDYRISLQAMDTPTGGDYFHEPPPPIDEPRVTERDRPATWAWPAQALGYKIATAARKL